MNFGILHLCARNNAPVQVVDLLLNQGKADPTIFNKHGETAMHVAVNSNAWETFHSLLNSSYGAKLLSARTNGEDKSVLMLIAINNCDADVWIGTIQQFCRNRQTRQVEQNM